MSCQLTNLASMRDHDIQELVWENGQLLLRSLSKIAQKNPPCDGERSRYHTADSVSGNSFLGLYSQTHQDNKLNSSYPNCMQDSSLQQMDDSFELLHEKCYTKQHTDSQVDSVQSFAKHKHDSGFYDNQLIDSQGFPFANHKQDYASKFFEGIHQHKTISNGQVPRSSLQQCQDSERLTRCLGLSGNKGLKAPRSSIPAVDSIPGNATRSVRNLQNKPSSVPTKLKPTKPDPEPPNESAPDEQSVAVGYKDDPTNKKSSDQVHGQSLGLTQNTSKEKPSNRESIQQLIASSSICSQGASNNPRNCLKRKYEDPEGSAYLSEKRRKRKMRALQELIPNCNKVDEVTILDDAIVYIKTLQLQLQIISMRSGLFMPPLMLPMTMQQINTPYLAYSPMVAGMDMRMQMGLGCCPIQFPTSSFSRATAPPGITEARLNMLGCPGQVLPMSISCSRLVFFPGGPSIHSIPKFDTSQVPAPMEFQCSAPLSGQKK
ncbi:hypothetical protein SLEP1_g4489 [Rubroshorea leprosula]|uniref:BHLH domain-containing protein n=1 Tax=Rubroshorea leprosula TaxID=152421 RepID=A0AAV5HYL8_9ROSI|nr:hypothetical protein SLEP1_g4489 [Rubroshorea leprosula]